MTNLSYRTAADNAWDKILIGTFPAETQRALRLMFSETECIERRDFTILHKIVLGLISGDLAQQLSASTADLNTVDNNGRVPLSLAAERGDLATVTTLLQYNPNVNIGSSSGSTPLHFASCAKNPSCITPLINAGALVDAHTNWKQTPLIYAAAYTRDARYAEVLLDAGAHIDWRDLDGITALGWTAIAGNVPVAEVLIRRGADVTNVDRNEDTIVTLCVASNRIGILRLLIGRRLVPDDAAMSTRATKNVLLVAAEHAALDTIDVLGQLSLEDVDTEATRSDGRTWREILDARADYDENIAQALNRLVGTLRGTNAYLSEDNEDDAGDELQFEDALEHQNS